MCVQTKTESPTTNLLTHITSINHPFSHWIISHHHIQSSLTAAFHHQSSPHPMNGNNTSYHKSKNYTHPQLREQAVHLIVNEHKSVDDTAEWLGISKRSISTYKKRKELTGTVLSVEEIKKKRDPKYKRPHRRHKIDTVCSILIRSLVNEYPLLYQIDCVFRRHLVGAAPEWWCWQSMNVLRIGTERLGMWCEQWWVHIGKRKQALRTHIDCMCAHSHIRGQYVCAPNWTSWEWLCVRSPSWTKDCVWDGGRMVWVTTKKHLQVKS